MGTDSRSQLRRELKDSCRNDYLKTERKNWNGKEQRESKANRSMTAQPRLHQRAREIQAYGTVSHALPLDLEEPVRVQ
jgi:hypothetical protein